MRETDSGRIPAVRDEELLSASAGGDLRAFETLIRRHGRPIASFVHRMGATAPEAQEVFARLLEELVPELDRLPLPDPLDIWFLKRARRLLPQQDSREAPAGEPAVRRPGVRDALLTIPRPRREALVLKTYNGLSYREIARVTGAPPGTIYYWIHIAIAEIAKQM